MQNVFTKYLPLILQRLPPLSSRRQFAWSLDRLTVIVLLLNLTVAYTFCPVYSHRIPLILIQISRKGKSIFSFHRLRSLRWRRFVRFWSRRRRRLHRWRLSIDGQRSTPPGILTAVLIHVNSLGLSLYRSWLFYLFHLGSNSISGEKFRSIGEMCSRDDFAINAW